MAEVTLTEQVLQHLDAEVAAGASVRSIAAELGISQTALRSIQRRDKRPGADTIDRIAARYQLRIAPRRKYDGRQGVSR